MSGIAVPDPTVATPSGADAPEVAARRRSLQRLPWLLVLGAVLWNLVELRPETIAVPYLDDGSIHQQMVRFATAQWNAGHLPLTRWFPYLGLGSPQFLHYQSLGAMITGLAGVVTGPDLAYRWSLYLLLALWPLSVYASARLFGLSRWTAGAAAALAPFLESVTHVGYEQGAYVWAGYGVWAQLWASVTLPLAWGCSWRATRHGTHVGRAAVLIALTTAFHFETGYLALGGLILLALTAGRPTRTRLTAAGIAGLGAVLLIGWAVVPVLSQKNWTGRNEALQHTPLVNGYGAGKILGWLFSGGIFDAGRFPEITILAGVGVVLAVIRWRAKAASRAILALFVMSMVLSFGRTTWGSLAGLLPGSADIFFRRFEMGMQLAGLLLAGAGAAALGGAVWNAVVHNSWRPEAGLSRVVSRRAAALAGPALVIMGIVLTLPAWLQLGDYDALNSAEISSQRIADRGAGAQLDRLIARVRARGGGRTYAGLPSNWGATFTVGYVPVFKYLESRDVDEVGYTLRTASLMTQPEFRFNETNVSDYILFGIRYVILPSGRDPSVPARRVARAGQYVLWTVASGGLVHVGSPSGVLRADRTNVGTKSLSVLNALDAAHHRYLLTTWPGGPNTSAIRTPLSRSPLPAGIVVRHRDALTDGRVDATVRMIRPGLTVLSASYDPGWQVVVDGHAAPKLIVAPALVGVIVPRGTHRVSFRYAGYGDYLWLFGLAVITAMGLVYRHRRAGRMGTGREVL